MKVSRLRDSLSPISVEHEPIRLQYPWM